MEKLLLDASQWREPEDFYEAYMMAVGAPVWHGHNLDALWDSLTRGGISQRNPPLHISITGTEEAGSSARQFIRVFEALILEARGEGQDVTISLLP